MTKTKIMLDPGHGGRDPGAVANGLQEKEIVLTIARKIRHLLLKQYEVDVSLTRETDIFVTLEERARMANDWGADYFLSIHVNASGGTGFESYIHPSAPARTKEYQQVIHKSIIERINERDRGMKIANFSVLRQTRMSALLTENLFIDNEIDSSKLKRKVTLEALAEGHVNGLQRLLKLKPSHVVTPTQHAVRETQSIYRVLINGNQVGAYADPENLLGQVYQHIGKAERIELHKV
ncbi:N-acetylmuramoyl-L-alanine amidase [Alkalihalobacillus oceani]|uniref:N-acetylmuramoyl-L-alanine amidase n=1 Tax=Halalkalibacter oceani TaxID=1653776 RepID=UPI00203C5046|nr:N-acetylmuramoyl-L-alanine amidase [Halalkalibacter oceani]MCM3761841.1 N-acetylmuramoyl-L-alanine amidase [Halalkalibacter oceani]